MGDGDKKREATRCRLISACFFLQESPSGEGLMIGYWIGLSLSRD